MSGNKKILVDADALIGLINQNDALHQQCLGIVAAISKNNLETIILPSTILEAATALSRGAKRPDLAKQLLSDYAHLEHLPPPPEIFRDLSDIYSPSSSTANTPFDYFLIAYAKIKHITVIFSFDQFYIKHGFSLAKELLK